MKIIFAGTPEIAVPSLRAIAQQSNVVAVLTAPDKVSGRGRRRSPSAVKIVARELGIPVLEATTLNQETRERVSSYKPSLLVVFAYGRIFDSRFLAIFPKGGINMHPSALPKYRGPSPLTAAILAGDSETALTVQQIALEMDAGDILRQTPHPLSGKETTASLTHEISMKAADELLAVIREIKEGTTRAVGQDHSQATYCRMIKKEDGFVDWKSSAVSLERMVRAWYPWPKAQTQLAGQGLVILEASVFEKESKKNPPIPGTVLGVDRECGILIQTGMGVLGITRLQVATKKPMNFHSFLNGMNLKIGTLLGN